MAETRELTQQYERAAGRWRDKMRVLGYYDGYLGFLSSPGQRPEKEVDVIDMGAGTGAFAEAWVAVNGAPRSMTLVEPSGSMLARGVAALEARGVLPVAVEDGLGGPAVPKECDELLVAHVIEHFDDTSDALRQMRALMRPGGVLRLVVSKPHWCNAIIWFQWRHRTFRKDEIFELLRQANFEPEMEYTFPFGPPSRTSRGIVARAV